MKIQNIYNYKSKIYYSIRNNRTLEIKEDTTFLPYFYQENPEGDFLSYNGKKLQRLFCNEPKEIKERATAQSWEADVDIKRRYIIDMIPEFTKSNTRWILFDIETPIEDKQFLDPRKTQESPYPVTNIVAYDNYDKKYVEFDLAEYHSEHEMLEAFCNYIKIRTPDLLLAWNVLDFDWPYLFYRIDDLAKKISPIGQEEWKEMGDIRYPALTTVLDLMALDHKFTAGKRASYAADSVAQEEFEDEEAWGETDFIKDAKRRKEKCLNDVKRMVRLVEKNNYIDMFDNIRIFSKCLWSDLPSEKIGWEWRSNNTKPWDMIYLKLANDMNLILPSKKKYEEGELDKYKKDVRYKKDGAYRQTFKKGIFLS